MRRFLALMFAALAGPLGASPAAPGVAEIALVLPLSGPQAAQSQAALSDARRAAANARGPEAPTLQITSWDSSGTNARNLAESLCDAHPDAVIARRGLPRADLSELSDCGLPVLMLDSAADAREAVQSLATAMTRAGSVEPRGYLPTLAAALHGSRIVLLQPPPRQSSSRSPPKVAAAPAPPPPPPSPVPAPPPAGGPGSGSGAENAKQDFPWPPPRPSTQSLLPAPLLAPPPDATLARLDARLSAALDAAGYGVRKYHPVPGGYAVVTRLERFSDDGRPVAGAQRWPNEDTEGGFSLASLIKGLFDASPGHYRVIVLVVRDEAFQTSEKEAGKDMANAWLAGGFNQLPGAIAALPWTEATRCTALVYEFRKPPGGGAEAETPPGFLPADTHLRATGLNKALTP